MITVNLLGGQGVLQKLISDPILQLKTILINKKIISPVCVDAVKVCREPMLPLVRLCQLQQSAGHSPASPPPSKK